MLEIVVLNKYLIRGLDRGYAFSKVREGKNPVVLQIPKLKKVDGVEVVISVPDYSNFSDETYPGTIARCFDLIIDEEVRCSDIRSDGLSAIMQIRELVTETKSSIDTIARVLSYQEK